MQENVWGFPTQHCFQVGGMAQLSPEAMRLKWRVSLIEAAHCEQDGDTVRAAYLREHARLWAEDYRATYPNYAALSPLPRNAA